MAKAEKKNFSTPDEVREFEKGKLVLLNIGGGVVGKLTLQPGWRWSADVKPIANTELCETAHFVYQLAGRMHTVTADGMEFDTAPGDVIALAPGHDGWVVGNEPAVLIDWTGASNFAKAA
jgi:hypothetical protein